jgi:hypothetical protein
MLLTCDSSSLSLYTYFKLTTGAHGDAALLGGLVLNMIPFPKPASAVRGMGTVFFCAVSEGRTSRLCALVDGSL